MKNVKIRKTSNGTYVVIADTERFGEQEIMFESFSADECATYCKKNGAKIRTRHGMTEDYVLPHMNADYHIIVRTYGDGHMTYNLDRNGKRAFRKFMRINMLKLNKLIKECADIEEMKLADVDVRTVIAKTLSNKAAV